MFCAYDYLEEQLQPELHAPHLVPDAGNFAIPAAVGRDLVRIGEADAAWVTKPRRIRCVEGFPTELPLHAFRNDEVFEHGEIHSTFAGSAQRVVPELTIGSANLGIADLVRTNRAVRQRQVAGALANREWEAGGEAQDAVQLSAADDVLGGTA